MAVKIDLDLCDKCGTCISVCTNNAIVLAEVLKVDTDLCSRCGKCVKVCPFAALAMEDK